MSINEDGRHGEELARQWLDERGEPHFQPDWIALGDSYYIVEAKYQERFEAPPFDGHGLPAWQVRARLAFQAQTGIPSRLVVFDKATGEVFHQWLHVLDAGRFFDTGGNQPRRVYPIENFRIEQIRIEHDHIAGAT